MGMMGGFVWTGLLFLILMALYFLNVIAGYWLLMISVIFIVVGFVIGFLILGSGDEKTSLGIPLFVFGIIMLVIIYFFPR